MDKIQTSNMDQIWKKNISGVTLTTLIILVIATVLLIYACLNNLRKMTCHVLDNEK
jgi:hypothetical protein